MGWGVEQTYKYQLSLCCFTLWILIMKGKNTHFNTLSEFASSHYSLIALRHLHNSWEFAQDAITPPILTSHVPDNTFSWRIFAAGATISFSGVEFPPLYSYCTRLT